MLFDLLKFLVGLAIAAAIVRYWIVEGPTPLGRGRWRRVLSALDMREREGEQGSCQRRQGANDYKKKGS